MSEYLDYISEVEDAKFLVGELAFKMYQQGRADAKKEINEIMDMDLPISNILFEIDKWLKEKSNGRI